MVEGKVEDIATRDGINYDQAVEKLLSEKQPSLRCVALEELAALCLFLASSNAASITGASMPIDGGWTAR